MILLHISLALLGLLILLKAADVFVDQAMSLATKFKVSSFVIGFTIVSMGTSLPELVVSLYSSVIGHSQIAVSNVIGSNIANLCLIIGIIALYRTFRLTAKDVHVNLPVNSIAILVFVCLLFWFNLMVIWELGLILVGLFFVFVVGMNRENHAKVLASKVSFRYVTFLLSLVILLVGGKLCIDGVIAIAKDLKLSESILGYFFVAVGTSLPELVTSFTAIRKGDEELSIGNIMGSNLFNLFFIIGLSSLFADLDFSSALYGVGFLALSTVVTLILAMTGKRYYFSRKEALILIGVYVLFVVSEGVR